MADERIRYFLDVDDNGTPKLVRFGTAAERSTRQATRGFQDMNAAMAVTAPTIQSVTTSLARQVAQLEAQAAAMRRPEYQAYARQQQSLRAEIAAMEAPQQSFAQSFLTVGNAVRGFMALQVVGAIKSMGMAVFDATAEMQSLKMGVTAVMGSSAKATIEMEKLREVAKLPGTGYVEAIKLSTSLQASGMSADMARKALMSFGNALASVGKGKAELEGVGLALSQIMSKGKVSAEEINQIAERVPQIRVAMQAAFGTASTEMIQAMGLTSKEFIAGVTDELGKLGKVTGGLKNGAENLSDAWLEFKVNLGGTGSLFDSILSAASAAIGGMNRLMTSARENAKKMEIEEALAIIGLVKAKQEKAKKDASYSAWVGAETRKEWDAQLAHYRGVLAKYKTADDAIAKARAEDKTKDPEAEKVAMVQEAIRRETKMTQAQELKGLEMLYARRKDSAKSSATALLELDAWYGKRKAEIAAEWAKKAPKAKEENQGQKVEDAGFKFQEEQEKRIAALRSVFANDRIRQMEKMATFEERTGGERITAEVNAAERELEAWQDASLAKVGLTIAEQDQIAKITIARRKDLHTWEDAARADQAKKDAAKEAAAKGGRAKKFGQFQESEEMRMLRAQQDFEEEVYQMRLKRADEVAGAWKGVADQMTGVWSSALFEMGKTNGDFYDTLSEGFTAMIGKMAVDLAANAITFGILSLIPGAGAAGAAKGMAEGGGLFSAILNSFDVGTQSVNGDQVARIHDQETIFPRPVSQAMRAGDWRPAMAFMGQSTISRTTNRTTNSTRVDAIHVHIPASGGDPQAIASAVVRQVRSTLANDVAAVQVRASKRQSVSRAGSSF